MVLATRNIAISSEIFASCFPYPACFFEAAVYLRLGCFCLATRNFKVKWQIFSRSQPFLVFTGFSTFYVFVTYYLHNFHLFAAYTFISLFLSLASVSFIFCSFLRTRFRSGFGPVFGFIFGDVSLLTVVVSCHVRRLYGLLRIICNMQEEF